jgi:hypothetical protein
MASVAERTGHGAQHGFRPDIEGLRAVGRHADLTDLFCTPAVCLMIAGNRLVFRDNNHITPGYAGLLEPVLAALVGKALGAR